MAVNDLEIERVQVYAVGPDTERYTWSLDHTEQFVTSTIVRITTRGGVEGIGGAMSVNEYGFTSAVAETMRHMLPKLVGAAVSDREALWPVVGMHDIPLAPQARSAIDIALFGTLSPSTPGSRSTNFSAVRAVACSLTPAPLSCSRQRPMWISLPSSNRRGSPP